MIPYPLGGPVKPNSFPLGCYGFEMYVEPVTSLFVIYFFFTQPVTYLFVMNFFFTTFFLSERVTLGSYI